MEFGTIAELYESGKYEYFRRDIITLLNNWPGEVDRARLHGYGKPKEEDHGSRQEGAEQPELV